MHFAGPILWNRFRIQAFHAYTRFFKLCTGRWLMTDDGSSDMQFVRLHATINYEKHERRINFFPLRFVKIVRKLKEIKTSTTTIQLNLHWRLCHRPEKSRSGKLMADKMFACSYKSTNVQEQRVSKEKQEVLDATAAVSHTTWCDLLTSRGCSENGTKENH